MTKHQKRFAAAAKSYRKRMGKFSRSKMSSCMRAALRK